jgi:hypothetical protein
MLIWLTSAMSVCSCDHVRPCSSFIFFLSPRPNNATSMSKLPSQTRHLHGIRRSTACQKWRLPELRAKNRHRCERKSARSRRATHRCSSLAYVELVTACNPGARCGCARLAYGCQVEQSYLTRFSHRGWSIGNQPIPTSWFKRNRTPQGVAAIAARAAW